MTTGRRFNKRICYINKCFISAFIAMSLLSNACHWPLNQWTSQQTCHTYMYVLLWSLNNLSLQDLFWTNIWQIYFYCGSYAGNPLLCTNSSTSCGLNPVQPLELASQPSGLHYIFNYHDRFSCHAILSSFVISMKIWVLWLWNWTDGFINRYARGVGYVGHHNLSTVLAGSGGFWSYAICPTSCLHKILQQSISRWRMWQSI